MNQTKEQQDILKFIEIVLDEIDLSKYDKRQNLTPLELQLRVNHFRDKPVFFKRKKKPFKETNPKVFTLSGVKMKAWYCSKKGLVIKYYSPE